jgi:hypothetical protein
MQNYETTLAKQYNVKNLKPFKKGTVNSPGRPKGSLSLTDYMHKIGEVMIKDAKHPLTEEITSKFSAKQLMIMMIWRKAIDGDLKASEMILDRLDGKVVQRNENLNLSLTQSIDEVIALRQKHLENE